jgi:hypothetical protein
MSLVLTKGIGYGCKPAASLYTKELNHWIFEYYISTVQAAISSLTGNGEQLRLPCFVNDADYPAFLSRVSCR